MSFTIVIIFNRGKTERNVNFGTFRMTGSTIEVIVSVRGLTIQIRGDFCVRFSNKNVQNCILSLLSLFVNCIEGC